ncbi:MULTISPECIES: hypothetical protein [Wolbachia]|uniref:hypothetical protein n=1 Tax=Wolbachia TaxID=953 RepID=UPI0004112BC7|nr:MULTISPECIES: hypothetical protein [Wolbachia]MDX5488132.1 hypothetical protein [Wolbachia endosymbiont of Andrena praecox]MDX5497613.1 hypothetical protein [Wolbachia endosymbiont of Lasioglossum nitidulum]MDX5510285.1 hypothetical protein [Wolbachia endosymbiont of Lasioglossum morio]MDX5543507.1 hypothetical protein [Wolbachia endosymbiont of Andrena apicata]MDX5562212.1 hypothetical protein [Wolbachia endosymbiont of Andrena bicolor]MDX5596192.1 hypothetical protein [Wolbachia endosymb
MLNINNKVNYEINIKRKEKKYSWSTVFAWLYLKTIGRILPKRWNRWAENILYYDKTTANNEVQTDAFKTIDGSVQVDLKPEVAVRESQSGVISKDGEVQTNKVTFHDIAMQTEYVETTDKNSDQAQQVEDLQSKNGLLEVKIEELRSIIIRLKADLQSKNSSLKKENRELQSIIIRLKKNYRELVEVTDKQEKGFLVKLKAKSEMIGCQGRELTELRAEFTNKINELFERVEEVRKEKSKKKKEELQEQVEHLNAKLERARNVAIFSIGERTKTLDENLTLKNQQIESSPAKDEQQNGKLTEKDTQGQTKTKAPDTVSTVSTAKSTTGSMKSKIPKGLSKLRGNENCDKFLSDKNKELKKSFSEFEKKHFCHNVLNETIKSLSNQDDGKFESSKLLELLESNLKQSAREIIEAKVKEVVNEHCNIGKNMGKELRDDTLKAKLSPSVRKCVKKLEFNKQEGVNKIVDSILHSFNSKNNNNNDSGELLKEIVTGKLTEAKMKCFSNKIQELQLALSIRDKFLSPDQGMCNQTQGGVNEYQLTEKAKKEHIPNSSMSSPNIASIHSLNSQKAVRIGS